MQAVKIQPQTFKSSYLKLIILQCSLVFSLLADIIFHAAITVDAGIGVSIIVLYGIIGVVYLIIGIVYILIRNVKKDCKCLKVIWLVDNYSILHRWNIILFGHKLVDTSSNAYSTRHGSGVLSVYSVLHI